MRGPLSREIAESFYLMAMMAVVFLVSIGLGLIALGLG